MVNLPKGRSSHSGGSRGREGIGLYYRFQDYRDQGRPETRLEPTVVRLPSRTKGRATETNPTRGTDIKTIDGGVGL